MNQIEVIGRVKIINGERTITAKNHFLENGIEYLFTHILGGNIYGFVTTIYCPANGFKVHLGSDTSNTTTISTTALTSPIGAPTDPDSTGGSVTDGSGTGTWQVTFTATWNSGTLPAATLGEMVLKTYGINKTTAGWSINGGTVGDSFITRSRLSSADGDFSSFVIDDTVPLTVEWTIEFAFA